MSAFYHYIQKYGKPFAVAIIKEYKMRDTRRCRMISANLLAGGRTPSIPRLMGVNYWVVWRDKKGGRK